MKTLSLNTTITSTEVFTIPLTNDEYTALLSMASDGASDEEITEWVVANCDIESLIEDYEKTSVNAISTIRDEENKTIILFNTTVGADA